MAAPPYVRTVSSTPLVNESNNDNTPSRVHRLPNGPCNFTNLSVGGAAPPRCGCQRFWDQSEHAKTLHRKPLGVCMCEHHACFHDCLPARGPAGHQVVTSATLRSSSQHAKRGVSPLSSESRYRFQDNGLSPQLQVQNSVELYKGSPRGGQTIQSQADNHHTENGLPDTSSGFCLAQSESVAPGLPPIPSQCLLPSDISSGGMSGNSQSFQSFPELDLRSLVSTTVEDYEPQPTGTGRGVSMPFQHVTLDQHVLLGDVQAESFIQSATEVITPSPRGSPEPGLDKNIASVQAAVDILAFEESRRPRDQSQTMEQVGPAKTALQDVTAIAIRPATEINAMETADIRDPSALPVCQLLPHLQSILKHVSAHPTLSTKVQNHEQRMDLLENVSSSYVGAQEVYERFDLVDERIGEVETRVEELEKAQAAMNDTSSMGSYRRSLRRLDEGDSPVVSQTSSAMVSAVIDRTEVFTRLETLESQFMELQSSALPSYARPWKLEVVFLPFGSSLKGIWSTVDKFPSQRSRYNHTAADDCTQTQYNTLAGGQALLNNTQPDQQRWEDMYPHSEKIGDWLVARACGQGSKVEERLRSRGLVKQIEVKGSEARDVQAAMVAAFGELLKVLPSQRSDPQLPDSLGGFYGLRASWIPLRKLHKDSRLRFLYPSEMVTPALWTVMFLSSSVAMRAAGVKRLYVTQRESYLQQAEGASTHWTWQKLRVLPRVFPDVDSSAEVREADALEACWEWDDRLDPPPSAQSSFASPHSSLSFRRAPNRRSQSSRQSSRSDKSSSAAASLVLSTTATSVAHTRPISPLIERHRPLHTRTTSMPLMIPLKLSPSQGKRRIASFDHELNGHSPHSSPVRPSAMFTTKRQRISRSPSRPRDTPRWSVGPPSPFCFEDPVEQKRGTTPFAYATPHSNAPYLDFRPHSVAGMTADDHDEHGSTTDVDDLDGGEHGIEGFGSELDQGHQPEDEVWEGVEDEMADDDSDQERKALSVDEDDDHDESDVSSQPSEYPSTQPSGLYAGNKGTFRIHVDEEEGHSAFGQQCT